MVALDPAHVYAMDPRRVYLSKLPQQPLLEASVAAILEPSNVIYRPTAVRAAYSIALCNSLSTARLPCVPRRKHYL